MSGIIRANNTGQSGLVANTETIDSDDYVDASIDNAHLADNAVDTDELAADAVTGDKIEDDAVNSEHYAAASIDTAHIADLQITTGLIAADAVTAAKIGDNIINSEHYAAASIDNEHLANNAVDTDEMADNAVTLAKMAGGTDGNIISYDASGDPVAIGTGTDGQVLTSTGAGSPPAFEDAAGGGSAVLIGTLDADDDATMTITGLDTSVYESYIMHLTGMHPATNQAEPQIRFGDSGGIDSGGSDYAWQVGGFGTTNGHYFSYSENTSYMRPHAYVYHAGPSGGTGGGLGGEFTIYADPDGQCNTLITGHICEPNNSSPTYGVMNIVMTGQRHAVLTLTQVKFNFSSGNVTSGRMTVWGMKHA